MPAPFDAIETAPVTVVAAYYGGWKTPPEPIVTWQLPSPWGVNPDNNLYMGNFPERFPLYGAVNEDDQNVIDQQLLLAESAGVGVFAVNWYRDEFVSYGATRIAASTVAPSVKWCVQWSNHYTSMSPTAANKPYLYEGMRRAALRMNGDRYWLKSGKPVIILFSATHLDDVIRVENGQTVSYTPTLAQRNALVADVRNVVGNVLNGDLTGGISGSTVSVSANPGPYLVIMTADSGWAQVTGIDAITLYNVRSGVFSGVTRLAHSFEEIKQATERQWGQCSTLAASNSKKFWPTVMAGWDSRPWGGTASDPLHDNCLPTEGEFRAHCITARQFAQTPVADKTVFVYAWNEFGEGGWIQPTPAIGNTRLDAVKLLSAPKLF